MGVIDEVKQKTDIVELIRQYATLKKAGRNMNALCPFHSEKSPSFFVYPEQQSWHCFGACSTGGDVFSFLMKKEAIDFAEALRQLAQRAGVALPSKPQLDKRRDENDRLYQVTEAAALYFHNLLLNSPQAEKARSYLAGRGLNQKATTDFQLGYALGSWESLKQTMLEKQFTEKEMVEVGLLVSTEDNKTHDRFRNRLLFPIRESRGRVTGFGARVLDDSLPKYVNSPQTPLFDKSSSLYGINLASSAIRQQNLAIIVEGYMDVIVAHQYGFNNVVAAMGTALTDRQISQLKRYSRNITLALDADKAGEEATKRGGELASEPSQEDLENTDQRYDKPILSLDEGEIRKRRIFGEGYVGQTVLDTEVSILLLPDGKDPDEVIKEDPNAWQNLVKEAMPVLDYIFKITTDDLDLSSVRDKSTATEKLLPLIGQISDPVKHAHYLQKLSRLVQLNTRDLEIALNNIKPSRARQQPRLQAAAQAVKPIISNPLEENYLALLLQHPEFKSRDSDLLPEHFENSANREIFAAWRHGGDPSSLREILDSPLLEYLDALINKPILATKIEERYNDYVLSLKREYFRNLERKRAATLALEAEAGGSAAELAKLKEQGIESSSGLREVFTQQGRKGRQGRPQKNS